jgi:hypothetical protein
LPRARRERLVALVSHGPFPEKGHNPSQKSWLRPASAWSRAFEPELLVEPVVEAPAQRLFGEPLGGRRPRSAMDGACSSQSASLAVYLASDEHYLVGQTISPNGPDSIKLCNMANQLMWNWRSRNCGPSISNS